MATKALTPTIVVVIVAGVVAAFVATRPSPMEGALPDEGVRDRYGMRDSLRWPPKEYAEALRRLFLAAELGSPNAQEALAVRYERGQGVEQDYVEAYKWYTLAATGGRDSALQGRQRIVAPMSPEQVAEAERRAREWTPSAR